MAVCAAAFGTFNSIAFIDKVHVPLNSTAHAAHDAGFTQSPPGNQGEYPSPRGTN